MRLRALTIGLLAGLLLAALPAVWAGTADDPEVTDAPDDSSSPSPGQDIVSLWIDDAFNMTTGDTPEPAMKLHLLLAGDGTHAPAFFAGSVRFRVSFVPSVGLAADAVEAYVNIAPSRANVPTPVIAIPGAGDETVGCRFGTTAEAGGSMPVTEEVTLQSEKTTETELTCWLPLSLLPGFALGETIGNLKVEQQLVSRGPLSGDPPTGGDHAGVNVVETFDTAPDEGFGRPYVAGGVASGPIMVFTDLMGPAAKADATFDAPMTAIYVYNWTAAPGYYHAAIQADVTNGTAVFMVGQGNDTLMVRPILADDEYVTDLHSEAADVWNIVVIYDNFVGSLSFDIAPAATPPPPSGNTTVPPEGPGTGPGGEQQPDDGSEPRSAGETSSTTSSKKSPGIEFLLNVLAVGLAVVAMRRRL